VPSIYFVLGKPLDRTYFKGYTPSLFNKSLEIAGDVFLLHLCAVEACAERELPRRQEPCRSGDALDQVQLRWFR
jgi:hypothetical protein